MLVGRPPFETSNVKTTYKRIKMNFYSFPDHITISGDAKDLIQKLLKKEPEWRLPLNKILSHDFFKDGCPETLPVSAIAWPPPPELWKTISGKTTSCESDKPALRPQSSNREFVTQKRSIFLDRGNEEITQKSKGCSIIDKGMMMSNRGASPMNTDRPASVTRRTEKAIIFPKKFETGKRVGSAIHRWMTRNRTEQYLMAAKNKFEVKSEVSAVNQFESQFSKYKKKTKRSISRFESKQKISTIRDTVEYKTTTFEDKNKTTVKVEYARALGPKESDKILISKWVDYSSKYGIGYKLSNGWYGVLYNDSTKMLLNENCFDFMYIRRESSNQKETLHNLTDYYDFNSFPESLKKKVILLQHFKSYLDGVKFDVPKSAPFTRSEYNDIILKKWRRAKKAILFRLSNKVIQVVFQDVSELILSSGSGNVTFITSKREIRHTPLHHDLEKNDASLFKRLNYAKEILVHMINPSKSPNEDVFEKENIVARDGGATTRSRDQNLLAKLSILSKHPKSAFETQGLVTSRSRPKLNF
jgi:hypothetical protein